MNMILLFNADFVDAGRVRLEGRRHAHIRDVLRGQIGDPLRVGLAGGAMGIGHISRLDDDTVELEVALTEPPPAAPGITLLLALPRPKVFRRVLQGAVTLGVKRIAFFGACRVEKSYWSSPWLEAAAIREQVVLGLEQGGDTLWPDITLHDLFKPFVEDVAPGLAKDRRRWVAHPYGAVPCPANLPEPACLAVGPEGGFTAYELERWAEAGFQPVTLGHRILKVEQSVPALIGRLLACANKG
jgi:RsmE family RNA methyltransferase